MYVLLLLDLTFLFSFFFFFNDTATTEIYTLSLHDALPIFEGKRGNPRIKPPFPAAFGVFGMPTTINNVETLAAVPPIVTNGPAWYKKMSLSNPKSTGTKLFSVCGHIQQPGNYELTMGFPLQDLVYQLCGGMRPGRTLKACIPGGSSVPILNREETEACLLDYEGAGERGTLLGAGGVIAL